MGIRLKLILAFILILSAISIGVFFSLKLDDNSILKTVGDQGELIASNIIHKIDRIVYAHIEEYRALSRDRSLQRALKESNQRFEEMADPAAFINKVDHEWGKADQNELVKEILINESSMELKKRCLYYENKYGYPLLGEIFVTNRYGAVVSSTEKTSDYRQDDEDWWQKAKKDGFFVERISFDQSAGIEALSIAVSIQDVQGDFIGVMKVVFNFRMVQEVFDDALKISNENGKDNAPRIQINLYSSENKVLYSSEGYAFGSAMREETLRNYMRSDNRVYGHWIEDSIEGKELIIFHISSGYQEYAGLGWTLMLEYQVKEILATTSTTKNIFYALFWIIFVFVLLVGRFLHKSVVVPLIELQKAVDKISTGDLNVNIHTNRSDEIGILAKSFLKMVSDLKRTTVSKTYVDLLIASLTDALVVVDPKTKKILRLNPQACELMGVNQDDLGEMKLSDFDPTFTNEAHWSRLTDPGIKGKPNIIESSIKNKAGNVVSLESAVVLIQIATTGEEQLLIMIRDVTKSKKLELELRTANLQLREKEMSLQAALDEAQAAHDDLQRYQSKIIQTEKLASIGQLAAGMAHEINNPVGFVNSNLHSLEAYWNNFLQLLRSFENLKKTIGTKDLGKIENELAEIKKLEEEINLDFMSNDIENLLRESLAGLERIRKIVLDLKTFARSDVADKFDLFSVENIMESVLNIVWNEIKYKAELKKSYGHVPMIYGNSQKIGQVFMNLLVNAAQAIKEKGEIELKTYLDEEHVCISVHDNGCGIQPEVLKKIFDPFYTTKPVGKGTGLGLSISYEIVRSHHGEILVASEPGQGTIFIVRLPVSQKKEGLDERNDESPL